MLKYILLGFLNYQPMTGYELKSIIDNSTMHFWHAYHSQIYTMLRKLEDDGLLVSEVDDEADKLNRRTYTITAAGQHELQTWLGTSMANVAPVKEELLVRVFFSAQRTNTDILDELRHQRRLHQNQLNEYRALAPDHLHDRYDSATQRDALFWSSTLKFGIAYEEMYLAWLDQLITTLESQA